MPEPKKRIIVDNIDFASTFQFPRVFRAITMALQPPRLVIGLLLVAALMTAGRIWDGVTAPTVPPDGLLAEPQTAQAEHQAQQIYREAIQRYVKEDNWPKGADEDKWPHLSAHQVLELVQAGYREKRSPDVGMTQLRQDDQTYLRTVERIDEVRPKGAFEATAMFTADRFRQLVEGVIYADPGWALRGAADLFIRMPVALFQNQTGFAMVFGLITMMFVAACGGAISRMVACEFAGQERLRIQEAFDFSIGNWTRLFMTLLLPLLIAIGVSIIIVLLGLLMEVPLIDVIGSVLYGLALMLGVFLAFMMICYLAGFSLLLPAVACENCDAADAQQRAFAYLLNRPLHLIGYGVIGLLGLVFGYLVVSLFAATALNFTAGLFALFTDHSAMSAAGGFEVLNLTPREAGAIHQSWHSRSAAAVIGFWQTVIVMLVIAFVFTFYFAVSTIVYLLMRRVCDGQETSEIWRPGLVRGTLTPMPEPVVQQGGADQPRATDRAASAAMRTATAMRYGSSTKSSEQASDQAPKPGPQPPSETESPSPSEESSGDENADDKNQGRPND